MTIDLIDAVEQYPEVFSQWREPLADEVELCLDWLAEQPDPEYYSGITAGSLKGELVPEYVRTGSMMAALVISEDWNVRADDRYLVLC